MAHLLGASRHAFLAGKYLLTASGLPFLVVFKNYRLFGTRFREGYLFPGVHRALPHLALLPVEHDQMGFWHQAVLALLFWFSVARVGSFFNVCVYRLPRGLSILRPRSRCPRCRRRFAYVTMFRFLAG